MHIKTYLSIFIILLMSTFITHAQNELAKESSQFKPVQHQDPPVYMADFIREIKTKTKNMQGGEKQLKRLEEYMLNRLGPDGRIVNATALNLDAYENLMRENGQARSAFEFVNNGSWEFLGPTDINPPNAGVPVEGMGRVNRFGFHPTDASIIYAATAGGGLWRTLNKGLSWTPLTDGIPVMNTTGVAVDFNNPNTLYLLSGDGDGVGGFYWFNEFTRTSIGVLKSTDGGQLWQPTGLKFDETSSVLAYNLEMSPTDNLTLYACTTLGLFRTQDGGSTWENVRPGTIYELEFKPDDGETIYCVDDVYVYVSNDGGSTWIDSTLIPEIDGSYGRMCIATCASAPSNVYVVASPIDTLNAVDTLPDHRGLWMSTNNGLDFSLISTRPNLMAGLSGIEFKNQAWYDFDLECNPFSGDELMIGSIGIWKSIDNGQNWAPSGSINGAYHADIHAIQTNPLDSTVYIGCDGGVWISEDFGETYEWRGSGLAITQYFKMATSPFNSDFVLAGAQDNGVHFRKQDDLVFDRVAWDDGMESLFHPAAENIMMTSGYNGRVLLSADTGQTFIEILKKDSSFAEVAWSTLMAFDGTDTSIIYLGFRPIVKSEDFGETFIAISADTISGHRILENGLSNPDRIYAGDCRNCNDSTITFEMYTSPNSGEIWERIDQNPGFPGTSFVSAASVNPANANEVWITVGRFDAQKKVYRSIDSGSSWTNETGSLPNTPVNAIIFEDNDGAPSGAVYIGTDIGVFYRNDDLDDWIYFSNNMPRVEVTDLDIDYLGGNVRGSTYGRGLWESELYTGCVPFISLNASEQEVGTSSVHQTSGELISTAVVDSYGSRIVYKSAVSIQLNQGFLATAQNGAVFIGVIAPCGVGGIEN